MRISRAASWPGRPRACRPKAECVDADAPRVRLLVALPLLLPRLRRRRAAVGQSSASLNVYNWSDYIEPTVIEAFTKETGIKVALRHLRFQRDAGNQAARRQVRLRRGGADRLFPRAPDQGRRVPEARQVEAAEPRQCLAGDRASGLRPTIRATTTPSTTCGARPASATTSRRRARSSAPTPIDAAMASWDIVFKPENLAQVQGLRRPHAGFRRRHPAGGAALSRPRSEHQGSRPISRRPPSC